MEDINDLNEKEFARAAAEGDEGVLAILRSILITQDEHRKSLALMTELMEYTNQILSLISQSLRNSGERNLNS